MTKWHPIVGFLLLASLTQGQTQSPQPDFKATRGLSPNGTYSVSGQDTIDPVSGNMMYQIPITSLPSGRAGFSWDLKLIYNSDVFDQQPGGDQLVASLEGGWHYGYQYVLDDEWLPPTDCSSGQNLPVVPRHRMILIFPDGSHHTLHLYNDSFENGDGVSYTDGFTGIVDRRSCQAAIPGRLPR